MKLGAWVLLAGLAGCGDPTGACVVGAGPDAGSGTFPHCDQGVSKGTCLSTVTAPDQASFSQDKSCHDVGYSIPCGPPEASNCFLFGDTNAP